MRILSPLAHPTIAAILAVWPSSAWAQCATGLPAGPTNYVCDSGTFAGSLLDTDGANTLVFSPGGTGTITGGVIFGDGADLIDMASGRIGGSVDQGNGADRFIMSGGAVDGSIQQGAGIDDFRMTAGILQSLNQGDNRDTFFMSGGRIIDAFDDGDVAIITGGRIGRINLKLDNNYFDMSGGTVDRNVVAGFGNDTFIISGGFIGGSISVSGGTDSVSVSGGAVGGNILLSAGNDIFEWTGGGIIYGQIDLGSDNDIARLSNLTDAHIGLVPRLTGGTGTDRLTLDNVSTGAVNRLDSWEIVTLSNDTELVFDTDFILGDAGTATGDFSILSGSTVFGGNADAGIRPVAAGTLVDVVNASRIDLTNGGGNPGDRFTIAGNYLGDNGLVLLDTELAGGGAPSDRLVIDSGVASGSTGLAVFNAGGSGDLTRGDGIMVIETTGGGASTGDSFALANRVAAGAYEYFLFRGGAAAATSDNWYLRSTITPGRPADLGAAPDPLAPAPEIGTEAPPVQEPPPPLAQGVPPLLVPDLPGNQDDPAPPVAEGAPLPTAPPDAPSAPPPSPTQQYVPPDTLPAIAGFATAPPTPGATPVIADVVPLYRIEVPTYAAAQPAAHHLARTALGTFHERRGEQFVLSGTTAEALTWARFFGATGQTDWGGTVDPAIDGRLAGLQAGQDLVAWQADTGGVNRAGAFIAASTLSATVRGQALGWNNLTVGDLDLRATSLGGYWTYIAPEQWYLDAVLMGSWIGGKATSRAGVGVDISGTALTASLEAGYPIALSDTWTLEPQGQLIWSGLALADRSDVFADIDFGASSALTGRLGLRLEGALQNGTMLVRPFAQADLWHDFATSHRTSFNTTAIDTIAGGTSLELSAGLTADLDDNFAFHARAGYTAPLGRHGTDSFEAMLGISFSW